MSMGRTAAVAARRILGVFAHPDDEVFCVGGTMATAVDAGAEAMIVSATRGEAGQIRDATAATRATLGQVREQELREACRQLGVQHVRCLDHIDGTLADLDRGASSTRWAVIDEFAPDVVVTFGADGFYGHPDHVTVGLVVTEACAAAATCACSTPTSPGRRLLLLERLAEWLVELRERFAAPADFARVFSLFAKETSAVGFADDHIDVGLVPARHGHHRAGRGGRHALPHPLGRGGGRPGRGRTARGPSSAARAPASSSASSASPIRRPAPPT